MIKKDNKTIETIIIKTSNKHTYIKPKNGYLEIHLSKYASEAEILKRITPKFDKYYKLTQKIPSEKMYLWGALYTLKEGEGSFDYKIGNGFIEVYSKNDINIKEAILKQELKNYLKENLDEIHHQISQCGYQVVPIKLKKLKSKFGSYHLIKHEITLNTALASFHKDATKYVIYHEYAHQKHPHHQRAFYKALDELYPNHQTAKNHLKTHLIY